VTRIAQVTPHHQDPVTAGLPRAPGRQQPQARTAGVLLIALNLQDGEPARLPRTAGPGTKQRRLPAAGRSRDDRHLPCRRAIQGSDKITPVDQPGSCWSHRQRPALVSAPDTSGAGHAVRAPSVSAPGQRACCQPRATLGSAALSCTHRRVPSRPALSRCGRSPRSGDDLLPASLESQNRIVRDAVSVSGAPSQPGAAMPGECAFTHLVSVTPRYHRNPVTTSYRLGGEPGHALIDTQRGDRDDNRRVRSRGVRARTITPTGKGARLPGV
jgi:hypothetical protein